jgi:RHS repeat-associated protein
MTQRTDARGVITTFSYDTALNRPTQVSYNVGSTGVPSTPTVTYTYGTNSSSHNNGRIITMGDGLGSEAYTYDQLGRGTQTQKTVNNVTYTTGYSYNLANQVSTTSYPSGRVVKNNFDAIGRQSSIQNNSTGANYASSISYDTAQHVTGFTYGNGVTASYGFSAQRLQLSSLSYSVGSTNLMSLSYSHTQGSGNNGQVASISDNVDSGRTASYTYDSLRRLTAASTTGSTNYPAWGLSFTYDRYGNRTAQTVTAGSAPSLSPIISTSTNRITSIGGVNFTYDANGNITKDDIYQYVYDAENRLVTLKTLSGSTIATYAYDGHSMRIVKVWGASRTTTIYSGSQVISEFDDAASNTYSTGTTPAQAIADSAALLLFYHPDHLTTRLTTDIHGNVASTEGHYPFGENWYIGATADPSVERRFTSYLRDEEAVNAQLHYAQAREHSVRLARFQSADPVRGTVTKPQRLNRYSYVMGDPINRIDTNGRDTRSEPIDPNNPDGPIDCWIWDFTCDEGGGGDSGGGFDWSILFASRAVLYWRPAQFTLGHKNHSFWYVQDAFSPWVLDAGPEVDDPQAFGMLQFWATWGSKGHFDLDNINSATPSFDTGFSPDNFLPVNLMLGFTEFVGGQLDIPYTVIITNSNTGAHLIGLAGGFDPARPPKCIGWYPGIDWWWW